MLSSFLADQDYVDLTASGWEEAARMYFDLRRIGLTVRSPIDCCIAQIALQQDLLLIHRDRDLSVIAQVRPLREIRVDW